MKMSSSFVTILLPRIRALLNGNVCKGLMVLHRSQMIPHILRFWVASVNKFNTNNLALFEFWRLSGIPLSSLHDILAFSRTQSELLGEMSNFKRKRIFFFFNLEHWIRLLERSYFNVGHSHRWSWLRREKLFGSLGFNYRDKLLWMKRESHKIMEIEFQFNKQLQISLLETRASHVLLLQFNLMSIDKY